MNNLFIGFVVIFALAWAVECPKLIMFIGLCWVIGKGSITIYNKYLKKNFGKWIN